LRGGATLRVAVAWKAETSDNNLARQPRRIAMSTDMNAAKPERKPKINITASGEKALKMYEKEIATYVRELPRLLEEGEEGRYALIKDDEILSIWDTDGDAIQAGVEKFGLDPICVMKIDARNVARYAVLMEQIEERKCPQ
jgi:hypothetical protein